MQKIQFTMEPVLFENETELAEIKYQIELSESKIQKILFTSTLPGEGKTTIALSVGKLIAREKKVLYIGQDSEFLKRPENDDSTVWKTDINNLYVSLTENIRIQDLDLLCSDYDYVLIDAEAVQNSSESIRIADTCDLVVLVIEANRASYRLLQNSIRLLKITHCGNIRAVLNRTREFYGILKKR